MKLRAGDYAPLFDIDDLYGRPVSLMAFQGRPVLVSFYRSAICPLCNLRLYHLLDRYPAYQQRYGLNIISFFESAPDYAREFLDRYHAPFPLIADRERDVYRQYGLRTSMLGTARGTMRRSAYHEARRLGIGDWRLLPGFLGMDGRKFRMPAEFLLGPDLTVRVAYYGRDAGDFLMFSELEHYLSSPALAPQAMNRPGW
jgi:peroxiredoxin Q/BCP